jgi:CheY-like chemotaxis protein
MGLTRQAADADWLDPSAARHRAAEVVFLDIGLPRMDGYEVARRLRAQYGSACPRLIALTGYGQPEDLAGAFAAAFAAHLTKPVGSQERRKALSADLDASATELDASAPSGAAAFS